MPFKIIRNDLTKMHADAIVNTANPNPIVGSGTDYAIYTAAGWDKLLAEREKIGRIERGQAAITPAFKLNARYIIHTVGPKWIDGSHNEEALLRSCYENSLQLARRYGCESIAFPMISTGNYGFPKDTALQIVLSVVSGFLAVVDMDIYLVVFDEHSTRLSEKLFERIEARIDDHYVKKQSGIEYFRNLFRRRRKDRKDPMPSYDSSTTVALPAPDAFAYHMPEENAMDFSDESVGFGSDTDWGYTQAYHESWDNEPEEKPEARREDSEDLSSVFAKYGYSVNSPKKKTPPKPDSDFHAQQMPSQMMSPPPMPSSAAPTQSTGQLPPIAPGSMAPQMSYSSSMWKEEAKADTSLSKKKFTKDSPFITTLLSQQNETFQQMLFRLMDERGITGPALYKKANINKQLFSKIKNKPDYQPGKKTIFALSLALELNLDQAIDLLSRAGYAFSPTSDLDKIIRCCFEYKFYDLYQIEVLLYERLDDTLTA